MIQSMHFCQITNDVNRSKNLPSPSDNFEGGQDFMKATSYLESLLVFVSWINLIDLT